MNVLVTGGAGYIGSHTCVELLERGHNVIVIDNLVNSSHKAVERVEQITGKPVAFYENDVRDRAALDRIFEKHDIDCAIHFAGLKAVGESVAMPLEYYDNNLFSTVRLCEAMRDHGVKNIVFSSSATVYSGDNEMPLREDSNTGHCTNPYGWTKYMSEQILRDTAHAVDDFSVSLLRYFNPIGAHSSGLIGEDPRGIPNNLMPFIAQVAVGRRDHLNVFGDDYNTPDGTGVRDYIHVVDLARGHVAAIEYMQTHRGESVFNLGTGAPTRARSSSAGRRSTISTICAATPGPGSRRIRWDTARNSFQFLVSNQQVFLIGTSEYFLKDTGREGSPPPSSQSPLAPRRIMAYDRAWL